MRFSPALADALKAMPGTWWRSWAAAGWWVSICCPTCKKGLSIVRGNDGHKVSITGDVTPSIVCTHPGCTFHETVHLDGWTP